MNCLLASLLVFLTRLCTQETLLCGLTDAFQILNTSSYPRPMFLVFLNTGSFVVVFFILWEFRTPTQCPLMTFTMSFDDVNPTWLTESNQHCPHVHACWATSNSIFASSLGVYCGLFKNRPCLKSYFCFKCLIVHLFDCVSFTSSLPILYFTYRHTLCFWLGLVPGPIFSQTAFAYSWLCLLSYDFSNRWIRVHVKVIKILLQFTLFSQSQNHTQEYELTASLF